MRNRAAVEIKLILIRHGATAWNLEGRYLGSTDLPLSEEGIKQLKEKSKPEADVLWVSPMKRCTQTAEIFYPGKKQEVVGDFREIDFGDFEGKNYKELNGNADYQAYIDSGGKIPFPNGESPEDFYQRTLLGFQKKWKQFLLEMEKNSQKSIAIVAHGGTIMVLMSAFIGGDYFSYQVKNGEGYVLRGILGEEGNMEWNIIS